MSDKTVFDMPPAGASFELRGGWVVRGLMTEFGLRDYQAAGLVGNLGFESAGFAALQEISPALPGSVGGYGWAQWTGPRRRAFFAWCAGRMLEPKSDQANYGYLLSELRGNYRYVVDALRKCPTLDAAVWSAGQTYERPGGTTAMHLPGNSERLAWGRRALAGAQIVAANPVAKTGIAAAAPQSPPDAAKPVAATQVAAAPGPPPYAASHAAAPSADDDDGEAEAEALNREELDRIS